MVSEMWTNWIIASNEMIHVGDRVELTEGRGLGDVVGVSKWTGWPLVRVDGADRPKGIHPMHIARKI